jgi:methyltransferase
LRARGAIEPPGDVYRGMAWAYPLCFVAMAIEGALRGTSTGWVAAGSLMFVVAKVLKYWAMATLGPRWSFRVLVLPAEPPIALGPYRLLRHPNYVGVVGELLGFAVALAAPLSGAASLIAFSALLQRRIRVENRAVYGA